MSRVGEQHGVAVGGRGRHPLRADQPDGAGAIAMMTMVSPATATGNKAVRFREYLLVAWVRSLVCIEKTGSVMAVLLPFEQGRSINFDTVFGG